MSREAIRGSARCACCSRSQGLRVRSRREGDLRDLTVGGDLDLEELARLEVAARGDDRVREDLLARVVDLHVRVVDPARRLDLVLDLCEWRLQAYEVVGGAQLRVLLGHRSYAAECLAERRLG